LKALEQTVADDFGIRTHRAAPPQRGAMDVRFCADANKTTENTAQN
jgi:hypothetical protein